MCIADGTLVPMLDHSVAEFGKDCRRFTHVQTVIDANSRLVVAAGIPLPGIVRGSRFTRR